MRDFVDGEVLAYSGPGCLPHEGLLRGIQFGEEGAVALGGSESGLVWDRPVEPACSRVYLRGGGGQPEGGHALAMLYQQWKGWEAGLNGQYGDRGGHKTVGDPSLNAPPERVESILHSHEGREEVGAI